MITNNSLKSSTKKKRKKSLLNEIMHLKQELRNLKMSIDIAKTSDKEVTNVDIMRRLSQLEKNGLWCKERTN